MVGWRAISEEMPKRVHYCPWPGFQFYTLTPPPPRGHPLYKDVMDNSIGWAWEPPPVPIYTRETNRLKKMKNMNS